MHVPVTYYPGRVSRWLVLGKPGRAYDHYGLRIADYIFGLPHLGDAAMPQVSSFGPDIFG